MLLLCQRVSCSKNISLILRYMTVVASYHTVDQTGMYFVGSRELLKVRSRTGKKCNKSYSICSKMEVAFPYILGRSMDHLENTHET